MAIMCVTMGGKRLLRGQRLGDVLAFADGLAGSSTTRISSVFTSTLRVISERAEHRHAAAQERAQACAQKRAHGDLGGELRRRSGASSMNRSQRLAPLGRGLPAPKAVDRATRRQRSAGTSSR